MDKGLAYGRSQAYLKGTVFQTLTWLRGVGVAFFVAGMLPLVWFMVNRGFSLKGAQTPQEQFVVPPTVLATASLSVSGNGNGYLSNGASVGRPGVEQEVSNR
jgi:hypothetical protein